MLEKFLLSGRFKICHCHNRYHGEKIFLQRHISRMAEIAESTEKDKYSPLLDCSSVDNVALVLVQEMLSHLL